MAINSNAFGRVTLTEKDADKFVKQVTYGRPNERAKASLKSGLQLASAFGSGGDRISFSKK